MREKALRFGVSDGAGHQAATWKLWSLAGTSDVYLACRSIGGILKASMHGSGAWHVAYTPQAFEGHVKGAIAGQADRFLEKWPRPVEVSPGVTLAFRIVTPFSSVVVPQSVLDDEIIWIPRCPPSLATEIDILLLSRETKVSGWPGKTSMGTQLVGSYALVDGQSVWAVHRIAEMPDLSAVKGHPQFYKDRGIDEFKSGQLRAIAFGTAEDGSRIIYDCAVETR